MSAGTEAVAPEKGEASLTPEARTFTILTWAFVLLSILARVVRYSMAAPLWADETYQAAAFLDHGYLDLLDPLPYDQIAPFGFLWIELTFVRLLGFHEYSLRLFPLLAGMGSVLLFHHVSRRLLSPLACLLAVAVFSSTYALVRYSVEVKPYGSDVFVSIGLIALLIEYWRDPTRVRWLWALAFAAPLGLCLSFPAIFVAGGISVGLLGTVWQARNRATWTAYLAFNLLVAGTFLALHRLLLSRQYDNTASFMVSFWADGFMPIAEPWRIPWWLVEMHTGDMFAYPLGGPGFQSALTTIGCGIGLACCWERSRRSLFWAMLGMLGLALAASALRRYPYGIHPRVVLYAAPPICLLFGAGAALLAARVSVVRIRRGSLALYLAALAILLAGYMTRDIVRPYRALRDVEHRTFAQWLWSSEPDADLMCVRTEGQCQLYQDNADSAYVCNVGMFHKGRTWNGKTLRCVVYHSHRAVIDQPQFDRWMRQTEEQYVLVGREQHRVRVNFDLYLDTYDVYRFLPREELNHRGTESTEKKHIR